MADVETIHLRGEGGSVFAFDLPLSEEIAKRLAKGQMVRVNEDGTPYSEDAEPSADGGVSADEHSLDELKAMAGELELPTSGTKADLAERINAKLAEQGE